MRVEFEFDSERIAARGYTLTDVHGTIQQAFAKYDLPCVAEGEILAFSGRGRKNDYSYLWVVIMRLVKCQWFLDIASACYWCENGNRVEDILSQARASHKR